MCEAMPPQITVSAKHFAALRTVVRFDVRVGQQVRFQVGSLVERPTANGTFVRRLLHVQDLMDGQSARLTKTFATLGALERFFLAVYIPEK